MLWTVIGCLAAYIVIKEGVDLYQSKKAAKVTPPVDPLAPAVMGADLPTGLADLEARFKALLASLGFDIKQLAAEIDQIKAYAVVVLIQPHVLKVVADAKQAEIAAKFSEIETAIGVDVTPK